MIKELGVGMNVRQFNLAKVFLERAWFDYIKTTKTQNKYEKSIFRNIN